MSEMRTTIGEEIARLSTRPIDVEPPLVLSALAVQTLSRVEVYAGRVREVLAAGFEGCVVADFESETLPVDGLPEWFLGRGEPISTEVARGREGFASQRDADPFDVQEWLEMLDPESRQWRWWDVTAGGPGVAMIWVDAGGEVVFNCEELHWLLYSCGARAVVGSFLLPSAVWKIQDSIGFQRDG
jgi:hypothetical protein